MSARCSDCQISLPWIADEFDDSKCTDCGGFWEGREGPSWNAEGVGTVSVDLFGEMTIELEDDGETTGECAYCEVAIPIDPTTFCIYDETGALVAMFCDECADREGHADDVYDAEFEEVADAQYGVDFASIVDDYPEPDYGEYEPDEDQFEGDPNYKVMWTEFVPHGADPAWDAEMELEMDYTDVLQDDSFEQSFFDIIHDEYGDEDLLGDVSAAARLDDDGSDDYVLDPDPYDTDFLVWVFDEYMTTGHGYMTWELGEANLDDEAFWERMGHLQDEEVERYASMSDDDDDDDDAALDALVTCGICGELSGDEDEWVIDDGTNIRLCDQCRDALDIEFGEGEDVEEDEAAEMEEDGSWCGFCGDPIAGEALWITHEGAPMECCEECEDRMSRDDGFQSNSEEDDPYDEEF